MSRLRRAAAASVLAAGVLGSGAVTLLGTGTHYSVIRYYWWNVAGRQPGQRPADAAAVAAGPAERLVATAR